MGLALVHWHTAGGLVAAGLMPMHAAAVLLVLVVNGTSFGLLLSALARDRDVERASRWVFASFGLVVAAYAYRDALFKQTSPGMLTTDGHVFMDVAARMVVKGHNPYRESLLDAFRIYQMPISYSTPLGDGDITDRAAYPALSFLSLVPAVLLHVPTYLTYVACFVAALALVVRRAPWWSQALVLVLFLHDDTFLTYCFGGVTDAPWMLCLVGAVLTWSRPTLPFVLVGLACSYKQHPWFVVPFLVVLLCHEEGVRPWRGRPRRFLVVIATVFAVVNLPFVLLAPEAWLRGNLEPLVAPMITLSEGLSALTMTGYVVVPRTAMTGIFWLSYALGLLVYIRHTSALRRWCWALPGVALFFSHRALPSYWYFYALPGVAALVAASWAVDAGTPAASASRCSSRRTLAMGGLVALAVATLVVSSAFRRPPFEVELRGPIDSWDSRGVRLHVRVTSRLDRRARPRFTVQSSALQPLPWLIDGGPSTLEPAQSGDYVLRATHPYEELDIFSGARLAVSDNGDPGLRTFVDVPPDPASRQIDAVPNGRLSFLDTRTAMPFGWSFERSDPDVSFVLAGSLTSEERVAFEASTPAAGPAGIRHARLSTILALPETDLVIDVLVPKAANLAPYAELYGLRLEVEGRRSVVLFGEAGAGVLATGERFVSIAAKREAWSRVSVPLRAVLEQLGVPLVRRRFIYDRARDVDLPSVPVELSLFASFSPGASGRVVFGAVASNPLRAPPGVMVQRGLDDPAGSQAWHARWNGDQRNHAKAVGLLAQAVDLQPTLERLVMLGDEQRRAGHPAEALATYGRALTIAPSPRAAAGLGWSLARLGRPDDAILRFEEASAGFRAEEQVRPRLGYVGALRGLATAYGIKGDCAKARTFASQIEEEDPSLRLLALEGCPSLGGDPRAPGRGTDEPP